MSSWPVAASALSSDQIKRVFSTAPCGMSLVSRYRHSATSSSLASATIPFRFTLDCFLPQTASGTTDSIRSAGGSGAIPAQSRSPALSRAGSPPCSSLARASCLLVGRRGQSRRRRTLCPELDGKSSSMTMSPGMSPSPRTSSGSHEVRRPRRANLPALASVSPGLAGPAAMVFPWFRSSHLPCPGPGPSWEPASRPQVSGRRFLYGTTTGQAGAPPVVQLILPWIAGLIGVLAAMKSAST